MQPTEKGKMKSLGHILLLLVVWLSLACGGKPQAMHSASPYTYYFPVAGFYQASPMPTPMPTPTPTPTPTPDPDLACFTDQAAVVFYRLLLTDSRQARAALVCDPRLVAAAKERAVTLAGEGALAHCDERGECVNRVARRYGCALPASYAPNGNNIESLAAGTPDPWIIFVSLAASPSHSVHLFARDQSGNIQRQFQQQTQIGIASYYAPGSDWGYYWVILIADCQLPLSASPMLQYMYVTPPMQKRELSWN